MSRCEDCNEWIGFLSKLALCLKCYAQKKGETNEQKKRY